MTLNNVYAIIGSNDKILSNFDIANNVLYFLNSINITSTIDLSIYFKEATTKDIKDWFSNKNTKFTVNNIDNLDKSLTKVYRKKFTAFISNTGNIKMENKEIIAEAKKYDINLKEENGKIKMPDSKKELQDTLKFLNGDIFHSDLYDKDYETNSKKEKR